MDDGAWTKRCANDFLALLHEGALLQATLGRQQGAFADAGLRAAPQLFRDSARVFDEMIA